MSTTRSVPVENPWTRWLSRCAWGAAEGAGAENGPFVLSTLSSKVEILETYLNTVYLGQDGPTAIYGVGASAARAGSKLARRGLMLAVIG